MARILVDDISGKQINVGDERGTFRGETVTITGWQRPLTDASTGRVYVTHADGTTGAYYPSVVGALFVEPLETESTKCNICTLANHLAGGGLIRDAVHFNLPAKDGTTINVCAYHKPLYDSTQK